MSSGEGRQKCHLWYVPLVVTTVAFVASHRVNRSFLGPLPTTPHPLHALWVHLKGIRAFKRA